MNRKAYNQFVKVARQPNHNGKYFQKIVKEDEKLFENTLNKIQEPVVRKETINERTQRLVYQYDSPAGMKKPAHMDNPNIIDEENWAQRPKKYSNDDRSTYPSDRDQRQKLDGWDAILKTSKGSKEDMKQIRETLNRAYKTDPSSLTKTELKIIGRGKQPEPLKIDTSGIDQYLQIRKEAEQVLKNTLNKIQEPVVRKETINERTQRLVYQYDSPAGMKKPAHMDNPNIIDEENWAQRPKKYSNDDRSTYPSDRDQRQKLDGWDAILKTSKGSKEDMKQIRETLNRAYKTDPSSLTKTELKIIGRGKQPEPLKIDTSGIDQYLQIRKEAEQVLKNQNNFVPKPRREFGGGLTRDFTNQKIIEAEVLYGPEKDKSR